MSDECKECLGTGVVENPDWTKFKERFGPLPSYPPRDKEIEFWESLGYKDINEASNVPMPKDFEDEILCVCQYASLGYL